ncbi:MAG: alginate export family protein [Elusimicrobiales bacterium]|nr:alginate export family protein [Elusimicrobiales bacterium]
MPGYALRLDISAETDMKAANYSNLIYADKNYNSFFISENTKLGFYVYGIEQDAIPDASLDIGISLQSISGMSADKLAENPPLAQSQESYPSVNMTPYMREAYANVHNLFSPKISASIGLQDYSIGQGISLGSSNAGFPGVLLKAQDLFWGYSAEIFYFNPSKYEVSFSVSGSDAEISKNERKYHVYGGAINNKTEEGEWQAYHFYQHYGYSSTGTFSGQSLSEDRAFTGIRYAMKKKHISFDGEAVLQTGRANLSGGEKGNFSGYAFMLKGSWEQGIYIFDNVKLRLAYGRSSAASYDSAGNPSADKDNSFYAALGKKYDGFIRTGYGAIAGASLYDINPSSGTASGLPDGASGLSIVNAGMDIPYKGLSVSADYYKFKADYVNSVSRITAGDEVDLRILWPVGKSLSMELLYAYFSPGEKLFGESAEKTALAAFSVKAKF